MSDFDAVKFAQLLRDRADRLDAMHDNLMAPIIAQTLREIAGGADLARLATQGRE